MLDVGSQIVPFEVRFFRDMCVRLYLTYVQNLGDKKSQKGQMSLEIIPKRWMRLRALRNSMLRGSITFSK